MATSKTILIQVIRKNDFDISTSSVLDTGSRSLEI